MVASTARSTSVRKATSSSRDWNRAAFPDTTCSTRPAMCPVSRAVSRPKWTTNACGGANAGLCSSWLFIGDFPYARMRVGGPYCALQACDPLWRNGLLRDVVQEYKATTSCIHKSLVKFRSNWGQIGVNSRHPLTPGQCRRYYGRDNLCTGTLDPF